MTNNSLQTTYNSKLSKFLFVFFFPVLFSIGPQLKNPDRLCKKTPWTDELMGP